MKTYTLILRWQSGTQVTVHKKFRSDKDAEKWQFNCIAICGKDQHGIKCKSSELKSDDGKYSCATMYGKLS